MSWDDIFTDPLRDFFASILDYIPRIIGALVLLLVAWILAKILRTIAQKIVQAMGIDQRLGKGEAAAAENRYPVARGVGTAVFWIVWILFILAILQVLGLNGVLTSITVLFERIFAAVPNILAAGLILVIAYFIARLVARLVTRLLDTVRFNEVPVKLGLTRQAPEGAMSLSSLVGYVAALFVMLFAIIMAADLLNFVTVNALIADLVSFLAMVALGLIVIGIGIFVANLVANILQATGRSQTLITFTRVFIIVLSVAIGLRAMGFANDIILLIFGLILGAAAIAAAIAFGLGGRQVAGELLARWTKAGGSDKPDK